MVNMASDGDGSCAINFFRTIVLGESTRRCVVILLNRLHIQGCESVEGWVFVGRQVGESGHRGKRMGNFQ